MLKYTLNHLLLCGIALALVIGLPVDSVSAAEKEKVGYRLEKWKTVHFEETEKAETHLKTVKKLGCETKRAEHDGHIDITYRCSKWREIALKTHDSAHKWEKWLKSSGFETRHEH